LANNLKVLVVCLIASLVYGAGAIFIITWNASVWGVVFALIAKNSALAAGQNPYAAFALMLVLSFLLFAGCTASGFDSEFSKLTDLQQRYSLGEQLAPARLQDLNAFKAELNKMKQKTKDSAFSSFLDARISAAEIMENLLLANLEMGRVNPVNIDCSPNSPLAKGKDLLDKAAKKTDATKTRIEAFKSSYSQFADKADKAGFTETRITELKKTIQAQADYAKTLWLENCEK